MFTVTEKSHHPAPTPTPIPIIKLSSWVTSGLSSNPSLMQRLISSASYRRPVLFLKKKSPFLCLGNGHSLMFWSISVKYVQHQNMWSCRNRYWISLSYQSHSNSEKLTVIKFLVPRMLALLVNSCRELVLKRATPPQGYFISTSVSTSTPSSFNCPLAVMDIGSDRKTNCANWIVYTPRSRIVPPPSSFFLEVFRLEIGGIQLEFWSNIYCNRATSLISNPNSDSTSLMSPNSLSSKRCFKCRYEGK